MSKNQRYDLEDRLIEFSVSIIEWGRSLISSETNLLLRKQLIRSSTSSALNYGEAQGAESSRDFVHKLSIVLKELRETKVCLKILNRVNKLDQSVLIGECDELIAIMASSIKTARKRT